MSKVKFNNNPWVIISGTICFNMTVIVGFHEVGKTRRMFLK